MRKHKKKSDDQPGRSISCENLRFGGEFVAEESNDLFADPAFSFDFNRLSIAAEYLTSEED